MSSENEEWRHVDLSEHDLRLLLKNYRKAVKDGKPDFTTPYEHDPDHPLVFVTKYCYYLLQSIENETGKKILTNADHKAWGNKTIRCVIF